MAITTFQRLQHYRSAHRRSLGAAVLLCLVMASAFGVVYAKHQSRKLFIELDALQKASDAMNIEWGQLQLEQSTLETHGRVESMSRTKLGMEIPRPDKVVVITP